LEKRKINNKINIVVTDSGLGGLSVAAELEQLLRERNLKGNFEITFFNSLADSNYGYNKMNSMEEKARVFDSALDSIKKHFFPDLILIACNTLSVVYPHTQFSKDPSNNVMEIVDLGVNAVLSEISSNEKDNIIILGTPTTIFSTVHKEKLISEGIGKEQIINQECLSLESEIQADPESITVADLIKDYLVSSSQKIIKNEGKVIAALCCTHYGYSLPLFNKEMKTLFNDNFVIVNPNRSMASKAAEILEGLADNTKEFSHISVDVVSKVIISESTKTALGKLLEKISPKTSEALKNYIFNKDLFNY